MVVLILLAFFVLNAKADAILSQTNRQIIVNCELDLRDNLSIKLLFLEPTWNLSLFFFR